MGVPTLSEACFSAYNAAERQGWQLIAIAQYKDDPTIFAVICKRTTGPDNYVAWTYGYNNNSFCWGHYGDGGMVYRAFARKLRISPAD